MRQELYNGACQHGAEWADASMDPIGAGRENLLLVLQRRSWSRGRSRLIANPS